MKQIIILILSLTAFFFWGCSAATGNRYEENDAGNTEEANTHINQTEVEEDNFDLTPYQTKLEIEETQTGPGKPFIDVWYGYSDTSSTKEKVIIGTTDGYRVQILSTDDLDAANQIRSEIYFKLNKEIYVNFEPPFYKVKVGDFTSRKEADDFKFKLNQLGYSEARVVPETVNLFE